MTNEVKFISEDEIKSCVRTGRLIKCSRQEYTGNVRAILQKIAAEWVDQQQGIVASIALQEVRRLDRLFDYGMEIPQGAAVQPVEDDEMPPISGITFDPHEVWPEEPKCWFQPCDETLVLILVTQKQANENDWTQARFFCKTHSEPIHVHATSSLPSGHIVGIVKEPTWEIWEARDTDA